jgi:hypothetical protein
MIGQQLKSDSTLSEFSNLIIKSGLAGLLNSYGAYTVLHRQSGYVCILCTKWKRSLDDFSRDTLKMIAYDHLINGAAVTYVQFTDGRLFNLTMSDRYLSINFTGDSKAMSINRRDFNKRYKCTQWGNS